MNLPDTSAGHDAALPLSGRSLPASLWAETAVPLPAQSPLSGDTTCDIAIIGAGFTGLRTALALAEAGMRVRVLDAQEVGFGASGRSGGQVNPILRKTVEAVRAELAIATLLPAAPPLMALADRLGDDAQLHLRWPKAKRPRVSAGAPYTV